MTEFEINNISSDLERLRATLDSISPERVKRKASKRMAEELRTMVRASIRAEPDITSPASLNSIYTGGDGPSMSRNAAWRVREISNGRYVLRPHPKVEQRAWVLNYGYPGRIEPDTAEALRFEIGGEPVFADSVEGPDATGYWEAAINRLKISGRIEEIVEEVLEEEEEEL